MDLSILSVAGAYQWKLALAAFAIMIALPWLAGRLLLLVPEMRATSKLNQDAAVQRRARDNYQPIQKRSMFWGGIVYLVIFALIAPFVITADPQPWWQILIDVFVILMFYDFFYYLTHRFLFHDGGFGPGPLLWVHSVHHRQHNPCRQDSNYLHPLETAIGLGLYGVSIGILGWLMGDFHIITIVITSIVFVQINLHNHNLMEVDERPYKYLKFVADMHHVHHKKFNAGNFATITLFYDWLFGSYDTGSGWGKNKKAPKAGKTGVETAA